MNPNQARQRQIDHCRQLALQLLDSPRGREAAEGGYYLRIFTWLYGEIEGGNVPAGVPRVLVKEWKGKSGLTMAEKLFCSACNITVDNANNPRYGQLTNQRD